MSGTSGLRLHGHTGAGDGGTITTTHPNLATHDALGLATDAELSTHTGVATAHHTNANDPSSGQKSALAGTSGTPGSGNKYVTDADARNTDTRTPSSHATSHETGGSDPVTLTYLDHGNTGSTETVTASAADVQRLVANAATVTLTLAGAPAAGTPGIVRLWLEQDVTGGRDWVFPGSVDFGDAGEPDWTTRSGGAVDLVDLMTVDGGTIWTAAVAGREGPAGSPGSPGAGSGTVTTVKDEGSNLSTAVTSIDFVGAGVTATGTTAVTVTIPGGSGGITPGQAVSYPSSFSGDTIDGSSTTPFVDIAAFDTKEVLNSRVLHLQTKGASKDQRVRVTLGTTKAGAFDVRIAVAFKGMGWSTADNNTYADIRLSTAADAQLAVCRLQGWPGDSISSTTVYPPVVIAKFGGSSVAAIGDNFTPMAQFGEVMTLRFVRDGSNVISYSAQAGVAPLSLPGIIIRSNYEPYTQTVSGTLARLEFAIHTPSGPGAAVEYDVWVDYLQSV